MGNRLYVGNPPYHTLEEELREIFAQVGPVSGVTIMTDRDTGRSRGYDFVDMGSEAAAKEAIKRLNGSQVDGWTITMAEARPRRASRANVYY